MKIAIILPEGRELHYKVLPEHIQSVRNAFPEAEVVYSRDGSDLREREIEAEIVIAWGDPRFVDVDYLVGNRELKWIHCLSAGVENLLATDVANIPGLRLTNSRGIHETPISEHVIGYLLGYYRQMKAIFEQQRRNYWDRGVGARELSGRTACIVGAGSIGQGIARRLKAFDLKVLGVKRNASPLEYFDRVYPVADMDAALAEAEIVIMAAPLTPETEGMFNLQRFSAMKCRPVFVNVGRGKCVVTDDLVTALQQGMISGAMIDTVDPEPLPVEHPLWSMEQVMVSPHIAGDSDRYLDRAIQTFADISVAYREGRPLPNEVDLSKRY